MSNKCLFHSYLIKYYLPSMGTLAYDFSPPLRYIEQITLGTSSTWHRLCFTCLAIKYNSSQINNRRINSSKCTIFVKKNEKSFRIATFSRFILARKSSIFYIVRLLCFFECFSTFIFTISIIFYNLRNRYKKLCRGCHLIQRKMFPTRRFLC